MNPDACSSALPLPRLLAASLSIGLLLAAPALQAQTKLQPAAASATQPLDTGHIAPYLNGEELAIVGALPLGMIEGAEFSVMHFQLIDGDKLVLMSDGIVEVTDADGNLFGFDRIHDLLHTADTAAKVAGAAQTFRQEDDISVIFVTRVPVMEPALS